MGKKTRIRNDLEDITELAEVIQVLKDVADTRFHTLAERKDRFARFGESFIEFFRMISLSATRHPFVSNDNPRTAVVVITSEANFMGDLNSKVVHRVLNEYQDRQEVQIIAVGRKGAAKLSVLEREMKVFEDIAQTGLFEIAIQIKNYLIEEIMKGRLGRVVVVYPWSQNFLLQQPRLVKLLPCDELLTKQTDFVDTLEPVILESDSSEIIGRLADMWIVCRLYEMLHDTTISEAAAQSQQLESGLAKLQKDKRGIGLAFSKARKADIDKSMREIFAVHLLGGSA
jgi:ATP synthase F1 gamma subunit